MSAASPDPPSPSLWRHPSFLRFWGGQTFSQFGEQFSQLVIPIVAVTILHATEFEIGILNAVQTLAFLVLGLPAGAWVDRLLKRRLMLSVDLGRSVLLALVPLLWALGVLQFWQLVVIGTAVGVGTVFFDVSYQSFVPRLVSIDRIADANGRLESTAQISRIAGPAAAGGLLALVAPPLVLLFTAVTYLLSFGALVSIGDHETRPERTVRRPLATEIREGLAWVLRQRLLVRIVATVGIGNLFGSIALTLLPVLALRQLGIDPALYGVIFAISGLGGLVGGLTASRLGRIVGEGTAIALSAVVLGVGLLVTASAGVWRDAAVPLLIAGDAVFGFGVLVFNVTAVSYRQRICPPELLGRMNASVRFVVWGVIPIGALASGILGTALGVTPTLVIGGAGSLLASAFVVLSPLLRMRTLPSASDASDGTTPPEAD